MASSNAIQDVSFHILGYKKIWDFFNAARISSETFDHDSDAVVGGNKLFSNTQISFDVDEFKYYTDSA